MSFRFWANLRLILASGLVIAALLFVARPDYHSASAPLQVQDPRLAPYFIVQIETHLESINTPRTTILTTIHYEAPDAWRIVEREGRETKETVILGNRAWRRSGVLWQPIDAELILSTTLNFAPALASWDGSTEEYGLVRGPHLGEETTTRVLVLRPDFGTYLNEVFDRVSVDDPVPAKAREAIHEAQRDSSLTIRMYLGQESKRFHLVVMNWRGPNLRSHQTIRFDYETPVQIDPPR
jgi:hypothetical protein